jgi:hypothetical protein
MGATTKAMRMKFGPSKGSTTGSITKPSKSYSDNRDQLGAFYLNATKGMEDSLWGKRRK